MNRFLVQLSVAAILLSAVSGCKCSRDSEDGPDDRTGQEGVTEADGSAEKAAEDRAAAEAHAQLRERQCGELVDRAWTRVSSTFRALGVTDYRDVESEYRDAAKNMQEMCLQMTDEQMGCVRSAEDVLFGLLSCEVMISEGAAADAPTAADDDDCESGDCPDGDYDDDDVSRRLAAPSLARWMRPALRAKLADVAAFAQDSEIPSGDWVEIDDDDIVSISEEGGFRPDDADDENAEGRINVTAPGLMSVNFGDNSEWTGFHREGDRIWFSEGAGLIATPVGPDITSVVDLDGDFVVFEQNERSACQAVHASGATLESECRVIEEAGKKRIIFRYRFPGTGVSDANEFGYDWVGDVLIKDDAEEWKRQ